MKKVQCDVEKVIKRMVFRLIPILLFCLTQGIYAQKVPKKSSLNRASQYSSLPDGYNRVGNTKLYYRQHSEAIDMIGYYNGYYYSSTYSDYGYKLSVKVDNNSAIRVDCLNGTTANGVTVLPYVEQQGELSRICYSVTNNNAEDVIVSLGTHADVMIGNNDSAPISRRIDSLGKTYGITMQDGNGAQLCVLFGSGLTGVTSVDDFWFGYYYTNADSEQMVGNYVSGDNYMVENGYYDSGMGWCWKERSIQAGATMVFSYLIGVGEVNLEPNSTFEATPEDKYSWNDLSQPHRLTLTGKYESPAGLDGIIDYAVEDSEEWQALTGTLKSGEEFTGSLVAMFDASKITHIIKFRTRDLVGNTTMLQPIEYKDVSYYALTGIAEKTYTGDSLFQSDVVCELDASQYELTSYHNNINAGTASFNIEGVFPYTIGRKTYTFTITPQPLSGELQLYEKEFVYNGQPFTPDWRFTNENYSNLEYNKDYTLSWSNNIIPGTGVLTVSGMNNYSGSLSAEINLDKAQLSDNLFTLTLPDEDITYDEQGHGASVDKVEGVGDCTVSYLKEGESETTTAQPTEAGKYTVYLEFADGTLYYGRERAQVGSFTIYEFNAAEWAILQTILPELTKMGWSQPWDVSLGMKGVSSLKGLYIKKGRVTGLDLSNQNLTGMFPYSIFALPNLQNVNLANNNLTGAIGMPTYAFAMQNPAMVVNVKELDISGNQFFGNIGVFANCFPNLTILNASSNCLEDVYPVIPSTVTALNISRQTISRVVPLHLVNLSVDSIATKVPSILLYDHQNQTFAPDINLYCETQDYSWSMTMAYQNGSLSIPYVSEENTYYGQNGDTLNVAVIDNSYVHDGSTFRISLSFDQGDANFDGQVNVLDLQTTILYIMERYKVRPYNFHAANLWKDDIINVQDVICHVNLLMDNDALDAGQTAIARSNAPARNTITPQAEVYVQDNKLMFNTIQPIAAFDVLISEANGIDIEKGLENAGFIVSTRVQPDGLHLIGYSLNGAVIPTGVTTIGTFNAAAAVRKAILSDCDANYISTAFGDIGTGVDNIYQGTMESEGDVFDLLGRKVNATHKGLYIRNGHKMVK